MERAVLLWVLISLLPARVAEAQQSDREASHHEWRVEHFTTEDGLPSNDVYSIRQDDLGFLWLGTRNGLVRYDGYTFTTYHPRPDDSTSIGANEIWTVHEDAAGSVWAGGSPYQPAGANRFDRRTERFTRYQHDPENPNSLIENGVRAILPSNFEPGEVWISSWSGTGATAHGGLSRLDMATGDITRFQHVPDDPESLTLGSVDALFEGRDGTLWAGGWGLHRFVRATGSFNRFFPDPTYPNYDPASSPENLINLVRSIYEDRVGILWVGTVRGLHRFDPQTETFTSFVPYPADLSDPQNVVTAVYENPDRTLWLGTFEAGLLTFDRLSGRFERFPHQPTSTDIRSIYGDRFGVIWVGSHQGGLMKLERRANPFTKIKHDPEDPNSLADNGVQALFEDRMGILWAGNIGALNRIDRRAGTVTRYEPDPADQASLSPGQIGSVYEDRAGTLWVSVCGSGLDRMERSSGQFTHYRPDPNDQASISHNCANPMLEDRAGNFWIATWGGGLNLMDRGSGRFTHYRNEPGNAKSLGDDRLLRIYEAPSEPGILWTGTEAGLSRFDARTRTFTNFHSEQLRRTMMMHEDMDGRFWVATAGSGLHLFDRESGTSAKIFTTDDGLAHNIVWSVLEDERGFLWLSTDNGLSRLDPESGTFRNFYARDGLPGNTFREHAHYRSESGELFFGGLNGIVSFFPDQIVENRLPPQVVLTGLRTDGELVQPRPGTPLSESISVADEIRMPYDRDDLTFEYVALHFVNPAENRHAYMLEGYDTDWVDAGVQRSARYPQLSPGDYVFRVKAASADGVWNEEGASVRVLILPPWWRTWWAYVAYGLVFAAGVFGVDRVQRRRVIKQERERVRERELEQAREIERAYIALKHTQAQLIQQEKLASLGQLTAGIAHEIKNPLNFVNNFAGLTRELVDEIESERQRDAHRPISAFDAELEALKLNAEKIEEHGRRADGIVRSMLDHSSGTKGERRPVDVNALVDEYVNLAYHGMRAQLPGFEVRIERDHDPGVGSVDLVPQEMGRVLLNLLNNAFQAVHEHRERVDGEYEPAVGVSTRRQNNQVEIRIRDNGPGIPETIRAKVFEPFFTTKPAGQGTGLGLSLSHDIVVNGHGGRIRVESEEGSGSEFIVEVPARVDTTPERGLYVAL